MRCWIEWVGTPELLGEVIELFIEDSPKMLESVRQAVGRADPVDVERSAHSLKGALLNMAAESAAQIALRLEKMGRARQLQDTTEVLADLEKEMGRLQADLDTYQV